MSLSSERLEQLLNEVRASWSGGGFVQPADEPGYLGILQQFPEQDLLESVACQRARVAAAENRTKLWIEALKESADECAKERVLLEMVRRAAMRKLDLVDHPHDIYAEPPVEMQADLAVSRAIALTGLNK